MENEWTVSSIEFRREEFKQIILQYGKERPCLKATAGTIIKASVFDVAELAAAILNGYYEELEDVEVLTIELYVYANKENVRMSYSHGCSKRQILESLAKAVHVIIDFNSNLPSGKTAYELAKFATEYLKNNDHKEVAKLDSYLRVGDDLSVNFAFKKQSFEENLQAICEVIPIHEKLYDY